MASNVPGASAPTVTTTPAVRPLTQPLFTQLPPSNLGRSLDGNGLTPRSAGGHPFYSGAGNGALPLFQQSAQQQPPRRASERSKSSSTASRKQCNCKNSRCLKLYCECFASGKYCDNCNCANCFNNRENEATRQSAVEAILERNPNAFRPKIQGSISTVTVVDLDSAPGARHLKGCNCKKSACLKKYCECFQANIFCSDICKCVECKNFEGSTSRAQVLAIQEHSASIPPPASTSSAPLTTSSSMLAPVSAAKRLKPNPPVQRKPLLAPASASASVGHRLPPAPGLTASVTAQPPQRSATHEVVNGMVKRNVIEELCRLLWLVADEEEQRLQKEGSGTATGAEAAGPDGQPAAGPGMSPAPSQPAANGAGVSGLQADGGDAAGMLCCNAPLYCAKERVVLEEFLSIMNKVNDTAQKKASAPVSGAPAAGGMLGSTTLGVAPLYTGTSAPMTISSIPAVMSQASSALQQAQQLVPPAPASRTAQNAPMPAPHVAHPTAHIAGGLTPPSQQAHNGPTAAAAAPIRPTVAGALLPSPAGTSAPPRNGPGLLPATTAPPNGAPGSTTTLSSPGGTMVPVIAPPPRNLHYSHPAYGATAQAPPQQLQPMPAGGVSCIDGTSQPDGPLPPSEAAGKDLHMTDASTVTPRS